MATIIIPAHNEDGVLGANLELLLKGLDTDAVDIVIACNGCTDNTVAVASSFAPAVQVLEIDQASKVAALNAGDAATESYPVIYLDADIRLDGTSASELVSVLESPGMIAAEPGVEFTVSGASGLVRTYYAAATALHGQTPGDLGRGAYAMSEMGRSRFGQFPEVIADDAFARAHFGRGELAAVPEATAVVRVPATMRHLIRIKTRSRLGTRQLKKMYPALWEHKRDNTPSWGHKLAGVRPGLWPAVGLFIGVQVVIKARAWWLMRDLDAYRWARDDSSRS